MTLRALLVLPALLLLPACGGAETSSAEPASAASPVVEARKADASAQLACRHFRNVVGDFEVLNAQEIREKVKQVHDTARVSDEPGVAENARAMLAAATADDGAGFLMAVGQMSESCKAAGL